MIIGMDFGTTNSGMAVYDGQQLSFIPLDPASTNPHVARSALYITNDRAVHIGRQAIETYYQQNLGRPSKYEQVRIGEIELTFAELPSFIREVYVEKDIYSPGRLFLSFKMGLSSPNYLGTLVGTNYFFLENIIATYLYIARKRAEIFLGTELDTILLGRPVRYSDDPTQNEFARERLLQAAFRAGYKTVYLEYEPVAAAYYYETFINHEQNVLIFDFGGGTLDISILRLGNPKTRRVLATGGIAIAGDVFDQKIVRAKLPPHLGEGETYRAGRNDLPIPSSYYNAFSNWQDLLALQRRDRLEGLQRIERTAQNPNKIRALIKIIESNYGLKIFDLAEGGKRNLSTSQQTSLLFNGPGFTIHETLTRHDFENIIHSDIRAIAQRLDTVIQEAGLTNDQIDAVIRTGGSSQIPAFIQLLERRFGADKVRDIDTFSSVTAGLGIIANQIQIGEIALTAHTPEKHPVPDYLKSKKQGGIPVIDLELLKKLMDLKEQEKQSHEQALVVLANTSAGKLSAIRLSAIDNSLPNPVRPSDLQPPADAFSLDEQVLLITTDYRLLVRPVRELADMYAANLDFEAIENFHSDAFGQEMICALERWSTFEKAKTLAVINTRGYGRLMGGELIVNRLKQRIPYQMAKSRGYLATVLPVSEDGELILISHTGRAVRMPIFQLSTLEARLIQLPTESRIIGAFCVERTCEITIATANGHIEHVLSSDIPLTTTFNTTGTKLISRSQPVVARLRQPDCPLWAITNQRVIETKQKSQNSLPHYKPVKLETGERLISLFYSK